LSSPYDLTTLADVKTWLKVTGSASDAMLADLITEISRRILDITGRGSVLPRTRSEVRDVRQGSSSLILRTWPIISVTSLKFGSTTVPEAISDVMSGWFVERFDAIPPGAPTVLYFSGYAPSRLRQGATIVYKSGYQISEEAATIPATPFQVTAEQPYGRWASDEGVVYASTGTSLTQVASSPAAGQYAVASGLYTFNTADSGQEVLISYGYVPATLSEACKELVSERYASSSHIGIYSKSLGGQETIRYSRNETPKHILESLEPYKARFTP
jgi:hypothetical protein